MHAANLLNRYKKGQDGCTPYRRLKGKDFNQVVMEFGEEVWYMQPGIVGKDKMDVRCLEGVWLGNRERSGEAIVGTKDGCIKVRSLRRKPVGQRWGSTVWKSMKGVPWEAVPGHPERELKSKVIMPSMDVQQPPKPEEKERQVRRFYIKARDVLKYGATAGCEGCKAAVRGGRAADTLRSAEQESQKQWRKTRMYAQQGQMPRSPRSWRRWSRRWWK